jgi:TolA-binding protein
METKTGTLSASDAAIIRKQLLWALVVLLAALAGWGIWWWGQDTGWGNPDRAVATKMDLGEKDFIAGRLEDAALQYQRIVDRYPRHPQAPQAMTQLATALQQLGREQQALTVLQQLSAALENQADKADLQAYTLLQIGKVKKDLGDYDGALQAYAQVRSGHPKTDWSGEAQSGIGDVLVAEGKYKDARLAYAVLVKELPGGFLAAEAQTSIGSCYEQEKNPKAALKSYQLVLDKYPSAVWDTAKARVDALKKELEGEKKRAHGDADGSSS